LSLGEGGAGGGRQEGAEGGLEPKKKNENRVFPLRKGGTTPTRGGRKYTVEREKWGGVPEKTERKASAQKKNPHLYTPQEGNDYSTGNRDALKKQAKPRKNRRKKNHI